MKNKIFRKLTLTFLLVLLFVLPKNSNATVYYITPKGNDLNTGKSIDNALSKITKVAEILMPGDTVLVRGGVYLVDKPIVIFCSGTEEKPIVFKNYGKERPVFNFSGIPGKSSGITGISFSKGSQYIVFDGFELANGRCTGMRMTHCRHITVRNCVIHDIDYVGLSVASDECLIENNELYRICMAFENCNNLTGGWPQVMNANSKPPIPPAIVRSHAMNNIFRGNVVHDSWGEGIDAIFADGVIIEDNIVYDVFSVGIYLDG